jgi:hypothetical protein
MIKASSILLLAILAMIFSTPVILAAEPEHSPQFTLYAGRGVDSNLVDIVPKAFKGELEMDDTYLYAIGYFHPLTTPGLLQTIFDFLWIPNTRTGTEAVVGRHHGLQENWEVNAAWQLCFAGLRLGPVGIRPGVGLGLSYALGTPTYEDGPKGNEEKRYRFQNFNTYELEWSAPDASRLSLVTRIHHRSGIFGIIAPRRVGSNFLTVGLRYSF